MTVDLTIAHCPRCGNVESVYVRDGDDLVCRGCCDGLQDLRGSAPPAVLPPVTLRLAAVAAGTDDGPVPAPLRPGRRLLKRIP